MKFFNEPGRIYSWIKDKFSQTGYRRISTLDATKTPIGSDSSYRTPFERFRKYTTAVFGTVLIILLLIIVIFISHAAWRAPAKPVKISCGNTPKSAVRNGCIFDVMSFAWSAPACFDGELMDEFLSLRNWTWWLTEERSWQMPFDDVMSGEYHELFVSWEYHITHCTFMWKKMHRAILMGRPLDSYIGNWEHTNHCESVLLDGSKSPTEVHTHILLKFPDCHQL